MNYVGTFISGFEKQIEILLKDKVNIINLYDGLVIFNTDEEIKKLPFFNNVFLLLNKVNTKGSFDNNIRNVINTNIDFNSLKKFIYKRTFKIKAYNENQPTKFDYRSVSKIEKDIKNKLSLEISNNPDNEFVIQQRREGFILFMLKLTNDRVDVPKGSLRPELAYLLVSMANLNSSDIVIDPFFGYGSIPRTIVKYFKYNVCFVSEIDKSLVEKLKKEYKNNNKKLYIKEKDATKLDYLEDEFVDVIVTDPPWNIFNKNDRINYVDFYKQVLIEFNRVLKKNGRAIVLMGNKDDFEKSLSLVNCFKVNEIVSVLVNGKKANIYSLIKK